MKTLLLFDIDGTLLGAEGATRQAIRKTFRDLYGVDRPNDEISFTGRTDPGIFRDVAGALLGRRLSDQELARVAEGYLTLLPEELRRLTSFRLMPGVKRLLSLLSGLNDIILGLETGNLETAAYMKLERGGIEGHFTLGGFASDSDDRTVIVHTAIERARQLHHDIIPEENIFLIGDSTYDIATGRDLGINTLAVCTGHTKPDILLAESPSCLLPDLSDTDYFLRCIGA
jgi:phosphoglycolate phosphatase-like HAD superfamily hydrolase